LLTTKLKLPDEEEILNYLYKLLANVSRYIGDIISRVVVLKQYSKTTNFHRNYWKRKL
jgi:hypothetical protein